MSTKDAVTKEYMQNTSVFADIFNYLLYEGKAVIKPEELHEMDTTAIVLPYGEDNKPVPVQKYRDVIKVAMHDNNAAYMILGIENQMNIHYAMPVRCMLYDAIQFTEQVAHAKKSYKEHKNRGNSNAEYLSGFHKDDKLLPVITLVVYFGADEWDAPKTIHEMLKPTDAELLRYVPDYRMNLIAPAEMSDEAFEKFKSDLKIILQYIKFSVDEEKLNAFVFGNAEFHNLEKQTAILINTVTGSKLELPENSEGGVDMCKAIETMRKKSRAEGEKAGIEKGEKLGIEKGRAEGKAEGIMEGLKQALESLIKNGIPEEKAKQMLGL